LLIRWIGAVEYGGLFERKISLRTAEQAFKGMKFDSNERMYTIFIRPETIKDAVVVSTEPQIENLDNGINVIKRISTAGDYEYINSDYNFELTYEVRSAQSQRELLLLVSGILFGIAGNFLANAVTARLSQKT
jgi:hypothetical protein